MKLSQIAQMIDCTFKGEDVEIVALNTLESAKGNELSFLANPKYIHQIETTNAAAIVLKPEFADNVQNAIISEKPYEDFAKCLMIFAKPQGFFEGVSEQAYIHESAVLGENCIIYPFVTVGANVKIGKNCKIFSGVYIGENVTIGNNCILYPNSVVMAECELGNNCCLQPGAVIGAEGFGYVPTPMGIQKIPQIGKTVLEDRVEVGANSCIDRAALDKTLIDKGTAIDNLVQIGHNVKLGKNNLIISQVGISGSTTTGDNVIMAGQAGISGHLKIGSNVTIAPQSGVAQDVPDNVTMGGSPLVDQKTFMRTAVLMKKFPELFTRVSKLEKALNAEKE